MATVKTDTDYSGRPVRPVEELIDNSASIPPESYMDMIMVLDDGTEVACAGDIGYPLRANGTIDMDHPVPLK